MLPARLLTQVMRSASSIASTTWSPIPGYYLLAHAVVDSAPELFRLHPLIAHWHEAADCGLSGTHLSLVESRR